MIGPQRSISALAWLRKASGRARSTGTTYGATRADRIVDNDRLFQRLAHDLRERAGHDVGGAAGCKWDDYRYGFGGKVLRERTEVPSQQHDECRTN
jgi:hypothetical protein